MLRVVDQGRLSAASDPIRGFSGRVDLNECEIRERMSGNHRCCAAYQNIVTAIADVAEATASMKV